MGLIAVAVAAGIAPVTVEPSGRRPVSHPSSRPTPQPTAEPTAESLVRKFLDARAAALLAGDEHGWLVGLDGDRELIVGQRRIYRSLRRMQTVHRSLA